MLKALKKCYEDDVTFLSAVLSAEKTEELYGMDEDIFMQYAVKLDPKTRKPIAEPTAEPTAEPIAEPTPEPQDGMTITAPVTVTEVKAKATKIKKK